MRWTGRRWSGNVVAIPQTCTRVPGNGTQINQWTAKVGEGTEFQAPLLGCNFTTALLSLERCFLVMNVPRFSGLGQSDRLLLP